MEKEKFIEFLTTQGYEKNTFMDEEGKEEVIFYFLRINKSLTFAVFEHQDGIYSFDLQMKDSKGTQYNYTHAITIDEIEKEDMLSIYQRILDEGLTQLNKKLIELKS